MTVHLSKDKDEEYGEGESAPDEIEIKAKVRDNLQELNGFWSEQYEYSDDCLEFSSGDQWDELIQREREEDNRPTLVKNNTRVLINRIVNPLRLNPKGIRVHSETEEFTDLVSGVIKDIEHKSRAQEAYEIAYENAVTCGIGWVKVGLEYEDDEGLEQKITIEPVRNPLSIYISPYSDKIDGSDAPYGVSIDYIAKKEAVAEWGEDVGTGSMDGINVYEYWIVPDDSVADLNYYELVEEKQMRYWWEDGTYSDEDRPDEEPIQSRDIVHKFCKICRFVGQKLVSTTKLPIPFIPLIPFFGDRLHMNYRSRIRWAGIVHWCRDSQTMINYYASNELELASLAPKAPYIMEKGQAENFGEMWSTANTKNHSSLLYNNVSFNGVNLPPPQRADNVAQTQWLIESRKQAQSDMSRESGVLEGMLGERAGANEAASSLFMRAHQGELATAQYSQNFDQSLTQIGRVVMWLIPYAYDTPRRVGIRDETGGRKTQTMNLSEVITPAILKDMDFEITAGPYYETRRKEAVNAILEIAKVYPESMAVTADLLVKNLDGPGTKEIAERLASLLPPALQEGFNPVQAQQELEQAKEQITLLTTALTKAQAQITDNQKDRDTDIAVKVIDSETKLAIEEMKQSGSDDRNDDNNAASSEAQRNDLLAKLQADIMKIQGELTKVSLSKSEGSYHP